MHVAVVQFDIVWEDKPANHRIVEDMLDAADVPAGAFVLLPELGDTGFSFDLDVIVDDRTRPWAATLAERLGVWLQAGDAERGPDGLGRNRATIFAPDGSQVATYHKVHPFSFGKEAEFFGGGDRIVVSDCGGVAIAPFICYDLRFPELYRAAVRAGAEVFTLGASWPDARQSHWRALHIARAIENQAFVVACNRCGRDPHLSYAGGSMIVSPTGDVLAEAGSEPAVLQAPLDLDALRDWRRQFPALADIKDDLLGPFAVDGPPSKAPRLT